MSMPDRRPEMWAKLATHAAARGARVSVADVCGVAVGSAGLSGAWVTATATATATGEQPDFVMCVTDSVCEELAELQLTLGEGPCHDVLVAAAPVLAAGLDDAESSRRWPAFTPAALDLGAEAVFAFPLIVGAILPGVMGTYRRSTGPLTSGQLGDLLLLADVATVLLLDAAAGGIAGADGAAAADGDEVWLDGQSPDLALHRAEIDQATGMLTVQLGVTIAEAFARLRAYAYSQDRRLADVASDIVARRLRLPPDPEPIPRGGP
jgi:ANTAR domain